MSIRRTRPVALATSWKYSDLSPDDRLLLEPLAARGISAEPAVWDNPRIEWPSYEAVVIRSCWDYHLRAAEFLEWLGRLEAASVPVWNPAPAIRWNHDKRYLKDLAGRGVDIIPTLWLERGERPDWVSLLDSAGWDQIVVKPAVSASAHATHRLTSPRSEVSRALLQQSLEASSILIQPYLEEIASEGEWSFLFIGGSYSHAVLKLPAAGDFRVQREFGGSIHRSQPTPRQIEQASAILECVQWPLLYARIDAVHSEGRLLLAELELIEPEMYFGQAPASAAQFADALSRFLA